MRRSVTPGPKSPLRSLSVPSEHEEQAAVFEWAGAMSVVHPELAELFAVPNFSGRLGKTPPVAARRQASALKREGRKRGIEDMMLLAPRGGYHGLLIEMKRVNAVPSDVAPEQRAWHEIHRARGYLVEVCKGADEAKDVLLRYLSLPPTQVVMP